MKTQLRLSLSLLLALILQLSYGQTTLVSGNTNLHIGFVLPTGVPILQNETGQLYTTDGVSATLITSMVKRYDSASAVVYKNKLYFTGVNADNDVELWVTDGTAAGTSLVQNIATTGSSTPASLFVFDNKLYFTADDGVNGRELWSSDGAANHATIVTNIDGAATSSIAADAAFFQEEDNVYFAATNNKTGLYKLTTMGISLVKNNLGDEILLDANLYCASLGSKVVFTVKNGKNIFTGSAELWVTDGTESGTMVLKKFGTGSYSMFPSFVLFKNFLYFDGFDLAGSGIELWRTDATAANTKLFKDIDPEAGASSAPILLNSVVLNNKLYFGATTTAYGFELWVTDGTAGNTVLFKDINPGPESSVPIFLIDLGALSNTITTGSSNQYSFQQFFTIFNGKLYFTANDGTHGTELWSTDGTAGNTSLVADINPGAGDGESAGSTAYYTTSGIYFTGNDGTNGTEPWVTDGTLGGTSMVANVNAGSASSEPRYLFIYNHQLYFDASNGGSATDLYKFNKQLTTLPVSLLNFTASVQPSSVVLNWTTANESNLRLYTVERSTDGIQFSNAGTVSALGNTSESHTYQLTDATALQTGASLLYYRLRSTGNDGKYSFSSTLVVQVQNGKFSIKISPNPVHHQLTVGFSAPGSRQATIRITDATGKQVYQQAFQPAQAASIQQTINVAGFANGTYFIQLITDQETKSLTFIKQ